jgi:SNF2 family DNA or RNA helicase
MCRESISADSMSLILDISKYEKKNSYIYDELEDFESQLSSFSDPANTNIGAFDPSDPSGNKYVINKETNNDTVLYEKIDVLIRELMNNPTKRYLVFSEFNGTFATIKDRLGQTEIAYEMLSGSTAHIQKTIQLFRDGKVQVLLLNARFFGAGLNLQMTDEIIIYHRMNSDLEKQVIGRAQRLGRQTKLSIRYLCYNNEIPEYVAPPVSNVNAGAEESSA